MFHYASSTDAASNKLQGSNIFTIAKRTVDGQDMLYQSMKLTNGIWVLTEMRVQAGNPVYTVSTAALLPVLWCLLMTRNMAPFNILMLTVNYHNYSIFMGIFFLLKMVLVTCSGIT